MVILPKKAISEMGIAMEKLLVITKMEKLKGFLTVKWDSGTVLKKHTLKMGVWINVFYTVMIL